MNEVFDYASFPRRLNLGCGFDRREGFLNVDLQAFHEPDLVADITDLAMLPGQYYEEILAIDVLEHLPRTSTEAVLLSWHRLLQPNGILRLRVPSLEGLFNLFRRSKSFDRHQELMQCLFGTQAYTGDYHLTSFTRVSLETFLDRAGFSTLSVRLKDEWLFEVTALARTVPTEETGDPSHVDATLAHLETSEMDDGQFIDAVYGLLLNRSPDEEGAAYYLDGLATNELDRAAVIQSIGRSEEYRVRSELRPIPS